MDIKQEQIDDLNAVVRIKVTEEDYQENVNSVLKKYRKDAKMPGFRPGKVPFGMIKKMYGNAVLADEINKLLSESLYKYIDENKIDILGNPLPKDDQEQKELDPENKKEFEFEYELGLAPDFEVKLSEKDKFTHYKIQPDDEIIEKEITNLRKRYGKVANLEASDENCMLYGEFKELDKDGNIVEDGISHASTVAIEYVEDEKAKKELIGLKQGDAITVNPKKISKGEADMAAMLGVEKSQLKAIKHDFQFEVKNIYKVNPADLNQELYDKIFGPGEVKNEEELKAKIVKELENVLAAESEKQLMKEISEGLLKKLKLPLPDEFLKKWLLATNKEDLDKEKVENEYEDYSKGIQWQLIENKIVKDNNIKVEQEEVMERAKGLIREQFAAYGQMEPEEEVVNDTVKRVLENRDEARKLYDQMYSEKVQDYLKNTVKLKEKEVSYDEFIKLVSDKEKPSKFNLLDKLKF